MCGQGGDAHHGTTQARPLEEFITHEQPRLLPAPTEAYDLPVYRTPKVHRDHHVEVARALYSVPGALIGCRVDVRADSALVRISHRGQVVKVHPRMPPGKRSTDPDDLPAEKTAHALRDLDLLLAKAARHGEAVGAYAAALLEVPLPWTRMRQVYRLLGLVAKWGAERVDDACRRALDAEAVNVALIGRMLERGTEGAGDQQPQLPGTVLTGRFARDPDEFAVQRPGQPDGEEVATVTELDRLRAACFALCAHVRDVHGVSPSTGSASQVEAQHQAAHAREGTPWHPDAWRLPDDHEDVNA